jgi:hypothetical protein
MTGILADNDVQRHVEILIHILENPTWREIWRSTNLSLLSFEDLGLVRNASDAVLWQKCQEQQVILITANRNEDGPDSLQATIRAFNQPDNLPVFTLADPKRIQRNRGYAERVAERLLEYLLEIDEVKGTGRLYLP